MKTIDVIKKTREYLDYVETHYNNVNKAWIELQEKCKDMRFVIDDFYHAGISAAIETHDISKLSEEEFVQYRKAFYPVDGEPPRYKIGSAWEHHKLHNPHHWQNWTTIAPRYDADWEVHCVCMVCDWMAMGYAFGDTAQEYYEREKETIIIPEQAKTLLREVFDRVYGTNAEVPI